MSSFKVERQPHVIIIGAGLGGISTAIQLIKQLGCRNFTIYEKATAVGGTWRDNTYPGCASDIPGHWYSLSTDLNPTWSTYFVTQPEIRAYWEGLYYKYDLPSHTKLGHRVVSSEWDSVLQQYRVMVEDVVTGEQVQTQAEVVFYATGAFVAPIYPKELGVDRFKGLSWHSSRWRHDVDLKGKRVGVIGNGLSVAQFLPEISADSSVEVINFCRTPRWYFPRGNFNYYNWVKWIFAHVPFVMRWHRNFIMARRDVFFMVFRKNNTHLLRFIKRTLTRYIEETAPEDQATNLVPNYPPGCKRIILDPGYLAALHRPNVNLEWDAIDTVVEDGIQLKTGEVVPLDVIIFGTGFSVEKIDMKLVGRKETLHQYFASKGGPMAYLGCCYPGFPNCFTILGPNIATGHASVVFSQESQINLAMQLIKPIIAGKAKSFEVTHETTDKYNSWLQGRLSRSVWVDCDSYYHLGGGKQARLIGTFPGPVALFWWLARQPHWNGFHAVGAEAWEKQRRLNTAKKIGFVLALAAGLGLYLQLCENVLMEGLRRVLRRS